MNKFFTLALVSLFLFGSTGHAMKWKGRQGSKNVEDRRSEYLSISKEALMAASYVLQNTNTVTLGEIAITRADVEWALQSYGRVLQQKGEMELLQQLQQAYGILTNIYIAKRSLIRDQMEAQK